MANAINRRFSTHKSGIKVGVARAIRGNYVDLVVDPTYKDNLVRYFQILRAIRIISARTASYSRRAWVSISSSVRLLRKVCRSFLANRSRPSCATAVCWRWTG